MTPRPPPAAQAATGVTRVRDGGRSA